MNLNVCEGFSSIGECEEGTMAGEEEDEEDESEHRDRLDSMDR